QGEELHPVSVGSRRKPSQSSRKCSSRIAARSASILAVTQIRGLPRILARLAMAILTYVSQDEESRSCIFCHSMEAYRSTQNSYRILSSALKIEVRLQRRSWLTAAVASESKFGVCKGFTGRRMLVIVANCRAQWLNQ